MVRMKVTAKRRQVKQLKKTTSKAKKVKQTLSDSEKLIKACNELGYSAPQSGIHMFEILEQYCKNHAVTAEPAVLRELLRSTHKMLSPGPPKSKIRGILAYFTRSPIMVTWMKLARVLKIMAEREKVRTFVPAKKEIPFDRVVDSTTLLQLSTSPAYQERIQIMDAKIERLKTPHSKIKTLKNSDQKN